MPIRRHFLTPHERKVKKTENNRNSPSPVTIWCRSPDALIIINWKESCGCIKWNWSNLPLAPSSPLPGQRLVIFYVLELTTYNLLGFASVELAGMQCFDHNFHQEASYLIGFDASCSIMSNYISCKPILKQVGKILLKPLYITWLKIRIPTKKIVRKKYNKSFFN